MLEHIIDWSAKTSFVNMGVVSHSRLVTFSKQNRPGRPQRYETCPKNSRHPLSVKGPGSCNAIRKPLRVNGSSLRCAGTSILTRQVLHLFQGCDKELVCRTTHSTANNILFLINRRFLCRSRKRLMLESPK